MILRKKMAVAVAVALRQWSGRHYGVLAFKNLPWRPCKVTAKWPYLRLCFTFKEPIAGLYYKDFGKQYVRKAVSANLLRSHDSKTSPSLEFKPRVEGFD